jgi:hypothetical protein
LVDVKSANDTKAALRGAPSSDDIRDLIDAANPATTDDFFSGTAMGSVDTLLSILPQLFWDVSIFISAICTEAGSFSSSSSFLTRMTSTTFET